MQPFFEGKGRLSEVYTQVIFVLHVESVIRLQMNTIAYGRGVAPVNSTIENTLELLRSKAKYAKTATRMQDTASSCPSLLKILEIYLTINSTKKKPATLAKARKSGRDVSLLP